MSEKASDKTSDKNKPQKPFSRRSFIQTAAMTAATLALPGCSRNEKPVLSTLTGDFDPLRSYPYRGWEDFYRKIWTWDKVVRSTHSANCTGSCSWKVYVRNGVMVREEQAADYPRISADLPDYNPRGCQKGGCFTEYVYSPQRLRYPLIRTGERGEGKWRRATWDEALTLVAEKLLDNIYNYGPDTNSFFSVIPAMSPVSFCAGSRLAHYIGGVFLSFYDWYCDLPPGEPLTWGVQTEACECADWFNSKYIVLWGSNISQTRIPDAHFAYEARYNGAKIVCISPDYNASATHADLYFRINPGTDGILALGVAKLLIDQNLIDAPYVKEQTDMPLLVLSGTNRFLRESDLKKGGKEDIFYFWDTKQQKRRSYAGLDGIGSEDHPTQRRRSRADRHVPSATGRWQDRRSHHGVRTPKEGDRRIHSGQSRCAHRPARPRDRTLRQRTRHAQAGDDHPRRRHQPLVPQRSEQPLAHPAGGPDRKHRQKRRRIQSLRRARSASGRSRASSSSPSPKLARNSVSRTPHCGATSIPPTRTRTSITASLSSGTSRSRSRTGGCRYGRRTAKSRVHSSCGARTT